VAIAQNNLVRLEGTGESLLGRRAQGVDRINKADVAGLLHIFDVCTLGFGGIFVADRFGSPSKVCEKFVRSLIVME